MNVRPGPSYRLAAELARGGRSSEAVHHRHGGGRRLGAPGRGAQRVRQDRLRQLAPAAVPDAELSRRACPPAGPGRDLGGRGQHRQPAGALAAARARHDPARVLGGGRRALGCLGRIALLARRRHHRLVRPDAPARDRRPGLPPATPTAPTTTPRSSAAPSSTASSPKGILPDGYATENGTGLVFVDTELHDAFTEVEGKVAYSLTKEGDTTRETPLPTRVL